MNQLDNNLQQLNKDKSLTQDEFSIFKKKRTFAETFRKKISNLIS